MPGGGSSPSYRSILRLPTTCKRRMLTSSLDEDRPRLLSRRFNETIPVLPRPDGKGMRKLAPYDMMSYYVG
ncbi:hypothetical protein M408DRAFT_245972 [Serendipita vermifera MAFF 305830]|uniref:Uncharacterized protein n=1 Tax=Serendipita vermifera MAFF 305830 TaxID=933852 RepID=A0A0C2X437_SERVB|nr:hypothetical protein M408DRAFT_245972 [Serendipita vermifera MAFF 305830]